MRFLIQRVSSASVTIDGEVFSAIGCGLLVLVGVRAGDTAENGVQLADKLVHLRIFPDEQGRMNRSALDASAELLLVSQFTLYGDCSRGRRPGFDQAAKPEPARELYEHVVGRVREKGLTTKTGVFQAHMQVAMVNDGPVTFLLEN